MRRPIPPTLRGLLAGLAAVLACLGGGVVRGGLDDNTNGVSDVFEAAYGPGLVPDADSDGDGRSDRAESLAGTHPKNGASFAVVQRLSFPSNGTVRVEWPASAGKVCRLEFSPDMNVWTPIGPPLVSTGGLQRVDVPLAQTFPGGTARIRRWTNLSEAADLDTIKSYATSSVPVPLVLELDTVETPPTDPDLNHYGQTVRGWIIPPVSGSYTFWISGDDNCELWLATDGNPASKQLVASVPDWSDFREFHAFTNQHSPPRALVAFKPCYFEAFQKEWSGGDSLSVAWSGPGLGTNPVILAARYLADSTNSLATFAAGRRLFFRVKFSDVDSDGDGLDDFEEHLIGFDPANATTTPRLADRDSVRRMLGSSNVVTVGAAIARAYETTTNRARFTFFRSGNLNPLTIRYTVSGSAQPGADYQPLSGVATLPVGVNSVGVEVVPLTDTNVEPAETVTVTVTSATGYRAGSPGQASVTLDDAPDVLYVANLRPDAAVRSGGYGTASLRMAGNELFASVGLSFGNLTTTQQLAQLFISTTGLGGTNVLTLPPGQVPLLSWNFTPIAGLSSTQIVSALKAGRLWARVTSGGSPGGEIYGRFQTALGWQTMPVPPTPPVLPAGTPTTNEAYRFLTQATFGPTTGEVSRVIALGYSNWITAQFTNTITRHLPYVTARTNELLLRSSNMDNGWQGPRQEAWWQHALTAPDQLRQRMALALSELFVISQVGALDGEHDGVTRYYDMLVTNAFANYRSLLEQVTLSPMMGIYLSMIRNQKPNPLTGSEPDENYAREIMQLFSIGLSRLNLDGTLQLDANGLPTPTYTQSDIVGLAHVFTGWGPGYNPANPPADLDGEFFWGWDPIRPMAFYTNFHDYSEKRIVNGTVIPAGQTGQQDLAQALDALFNHPNTGPFVARQLIQRFVTSNPSPGYIHRVASVFNNNGSGVRGDLKAVIRAVLLDYEARSTAPLSDQTFGKSREPLIRLTHLLRSMGATPNKPGDSRFFLNLQWNLDEQAPLLSPSVFNFFQPGYTHPGPIAAAGLVSPEFQITSETTVIKQVNLQHAAIFWDLWTSEPLPGTNSNVTVTLNIAPELAVLTAASGTQTLKEGLLLDRLNTKLLNGRMSAGLRQNIVTAYASLPGWFDSSIWAQEERVRLAVYLIYASPEFAIQR